MTYKVNLLSYPQCCGIFILENFWRNMGREGMTDPENCCRTPCKSCKDKWDSPNETPKEHKTRVSDQVTYFIKQYKGAKSFFLAVLNEVEDKQLSGVFLELGFTILVPMRNNPSGSKIITYMYDLLPAPKVAKSSIRVTA